MKYVAKDMGAAAEVNRGDSNQLAELAKLASLALGLIVLIYFCIVYTSEYFVSGISVENEKQWLGKIELSSIGGSNAVESTDALELANAILLRLVQQPQVPLLDYHLILLDNSEPNAFAFPGGTIGLTQGLLNEVTNETGLAFVLAHELGHFKHRHHLKGFSKALSLSIVFSVIFGSNTDLVITQNVINLLNHQHSQQQEQESDEFAVNLVFAAYGNADNIDQLFRILQNRDSKLLNFLSSHPTSESRIEHLATLSQQLNESK